MLYEGFKGGHSTIVIVPSTALGTMTPGDTTGTIVLAKTINNEPKEQRDSKQRPQNEEYYGGRPISHLEQFPFHPKCIRIFSSIWALINVWPTLQHLPVPPGLAVIVFGNLILPSSWFYSD